MTIAWEYKSVPIILHLSGGFQPQDLDEHKQVLADEGWEYIDMRALSQKRDDIA